jgi:hypothetical protein
MSLKPTGVVMLEAMQAVITERTTHMPQVINGIGTWYYGKRNRFTSKDVCQKCGQVVDISSYDTTLFFVFFFIPIIPLKKRHIINYCPQCTHHGVASLKEWEEGRETDLTQCVMALHDLPHDQEKALEALRMHAAYNAVEEFDRLAPLVKQAFADNGEVLFEMGCIELYFGQLDRAEQTLLLARQYHPDTEVVNEQLADVYIQSFEPEKAQQYLKHITADTDAAKTPFLVRLAGAWQAVGDHPQALAALEEAAIISPEIRSEKLFKRMQKLSEKNRASGKRIQPDWLQSKQTGFDKNHRDFSGRLAAIVPMVLIVILLLIYLVTAFVKGQNHQVYLVNGLNTAYSITINEKRYLLHPRQPKSIYLAEGTTPVVLGPAYPGEKDSVIRIDTNFFLRPFSNHVFVYNPDLAAIVVKDSQTYFPENEMPVDEKEEEQPVFSAQKALHVFKGADYYFCEYPEAIELSSGDPEKVERITLAGLKQPSPGGPYFTAYLLTSDLDRATDYLLHFGELQPYEHLIPYWLNYLLPPEDFMEHAKPFLAKRPLLLDWHRTYQEESLIAGHGDALYQEYSAMHASDPENKVLLYLLGRASQDADERTALWHKAIAPPDPLVRVYYSLSFDQLASASPEKALEYARKGLSMEPDNPIYRGMLKTCCEANGLWKEAFDLHCETVHLTPQDLGYHYELVFMHARMGNVDKAQTCLKSLQKQFFRNAPAKVRQENKALMNGWIHYYSGDYEEAKRQLLARNDPWWQFVDAIENGKMEEAESIAKMNDFYSLENLTLLYAAEMRSGRMEQADNYLKRLVEEWKNFGTHEGYLYGLALESGAETDIESLLHLPMETNAKAHALYALAYRYAAWRTQLLRLASRLCYHELFPKHLIDIALTESMQSDSKQTRNSQ